MVKFCNFVNQVRNEPFDGLIKFLFVNVVSTYWFLETDFKNVKTDKVNL